MLPWQARYTPVVAISRVPGARLRVQRMVSTQFQQLRALKSEMSLEYSERHSCAQLDGADGDAAASQDEDEVWSPAAATATATPPLQDSAVTGAEGVRGGGHSFTLRCNTRARRPNPALQRAPRLRRAS